MRSPRTRRSRLPISRLLIVAWASALLLGISADPPRDEAAHTDAVPSARPPGFEPVDVQEEVEAIRAKELRELERQVDADAYYRNITAEQRIRARYGGATWNLYEPYE